MEKVKGLALTWPRISWEVAHSNNWRYEMVEEGGELKIIPGRAKTVGRYFGVRNGILFILLLASPALFIGDREGKLWVILFAVLLGGGTMLGKYVVDDEDKDELAKGAVLTIGVEAREVRLPRSEVVIPVENIVSVEIVENKDVQMELQIVTADMAWPVLGTQGHHEKKVRRIGETVAGKIKKELYEVTERERKLIAS